MDVVLRVILRRVLPISMFTTLIIAGSMILLYTLSLLEPVPLPVIIGIAVAISMQVVIGIVVALLIRLRQEKAPNVWEMQPPSDPSAAYELFRLRDRHQQKTARNRLRKPRPSGLNASATANVLFNQPNGDLNSRSRTTGQPKRLGSPHVHWLQPFVTKSLDQRENNGLDQFPRARGPLSLSPYPWFVTSDESFADGFNACPLFARSSDLEAPRSDPIPSSLQTGAKASQPQSQQSLKSPQVPLSEKSAPGVEPSLRRVKGLEEIHDEYAKGEDHMDEINLELGDLRR